MEKELVREVSFSVSGEFITDISRQWFWNENKDYEVVEELLLSCLVNDEVSLDERKNIALQIVEGRKKLVGVNALSVEDDNELVRPLYLKIRELKDKEIINSIKNDMMNHPHLYIDEFSTTKTYSKYLELMNEDTFENLEYWELFEKFNYDDNDDALDSDVTENGFWLFDREKLIFELIGGVITSYNRSEFFKKLYEYLKDKKTFESRQKRFEQVQRVQNLEDDGKLPPYNEENYLFGSPELNYFNKPDNFVSDLAWINKYGEWYSCDFGGHQVKSEAIIRGNEALQKEYEAFLDEFGEREGYTWYVPLKDSSFRVSGAETYQEFLMRKGWVKFHNPSMGESYPQHYLKITKEQNDAMFKASIKFKYRHIRGLIED